VAKRLQLLKKGRDIALEQSMQAGYTNKNNHDAKASLQNLKEGEYTYLDNQLFLGKTKNLLIDRLDHI
jgi:hypothetical protein